MDGPTLAQRVRKKPQVPLDVGDVAVKDVRALLPLRVGNETAYTPSDVVYVLTRYLAGRCDGAMHPDGQGFNKIDAKLGHKLAEVPLETWTPRQLWAARQMLSRYRNTQIKQWWDAVPTIAEPAKTKRESEYADWKRKQDPTWTPPPPDRHLMLDTIEGKTVVVLKHEYNENLINAIKSLPQKRYDPEKKRWYLPLHLDTLEKSIEFALEWGYEIPKEVHDEVDKTLTSFSKLLELSHAANADFDIPGLGGTLFPFQRAGVEYAINAGDVMIADEMGLGKTPQSLATILAQNLFPAVVICPASLKRNWEREARKWIPGIKTQVLSSGYEPIMHWDKTPVYDLLILNYNYRVVGSWIDRLIELNPKAIICDEAHNLKNAKAQQTKLVAELLKKTNARKIFLTGTPVVNRPMEFWQLVKMLGYANALGGYTEYKARYDNSMTSRLQELNQRVRTMFFVRRLKKDVLPELPDKLYQTVPLDITNRTEYSAAEANLADYFGNKKANDQAFLDELTRNAHNAAAKLGIDPQQIIDEGIKNRYNAAYMIAEENEALMRWEELKQLALKGKYKALRAWIDDFMADTDNKLVLFGLHTDMIVDLQRTYADRYGAVMIHGGIQPDKRMPIVDRFQTDPDCRLFIGNMIAAGEGLTLTASSHVGFFEFGWNPKTMNQAEDRCHRIGQKDSVTVYSLVAERTIDEEIVALIDQKRAIVDAIQDGSGAYNQRLFMADLQARMDQRRKGVRMQPATLIDDLPSDIDTEIDHHMHGLLRVSR